MIVANWPQERAAHWRALVVARAIENQAFVVAVNRTGSDPEFSFAGGSLIVSPTGEILAEGGSEAAAVSAFVDHESLVEWRRRFPALADRRADLGDDFAIDSNDVSTSARVELRYAPHPSVELVQKRLDHGIKEMFAKFPR